MKYPTVVQGNCSLCLKKDIVGIRLKVGKPNIGIATICDSCLDYMLRVIRAYPDKIEV